MGAPKNLQPCWHTYRCGRTIPGLYGERLCASTKGTTFVYETSYSRLGLIWIYALTENKWWDTTGSHHLGKPHIFVTGKHRLRNSCSQPASKKEDQDDYDDESHSATWVISPGPTVRPSRQRAQQHQNQHDEKNCVHETLLDFRS